MDSANDHTAYQTQAAANAYNNGQGSLNKVPILLPSVASI
jgi:hypothetical protein